MQITTYSSDIVAESSSVYDFHVATISGEKIQLEQYRGQVLLIVNVASRCMFTGQFSQLQAWYDRYRSQGLVILGFPCNQFANQEPKSNPEIASFCSLTYNVDFPLFEKIDVNGANASPLFTFLKKRAKGMFGTEAIKWNFTKFLVDRAGNVLERYSPTTSSRRITEAIEDALTRPSV
jgi:glutathione peroxidase